MGSGKGKVARVQLGVKAIEVGSRVMRVLVQSSGAMALNELAAGAGLSPSAAHRYLVSYMRIGLVQQDPKTRLYDLGPTSVTYGLAAIGRSGLLSRAEEVQLELRTQLDESTLLAIWGTHGPVVLNVAESSKAIMVTMRVGATMPLLRTATGLVFAALLPRSVTQPVIEAEVAAGRVDADYMTPKARELEFAGIRHSKLALHKGKLLPGFPAVASPLVDWRGRLVAVLSVFGHSPDFDPSPDGRIAQSLLAATAGFLDAPAGDNGR